MYWRVHWSNLPAFTAANAWSQPWGEYGEVEPERGYSAQESAAELLQYFEGRAGIDDEPVVFFEGEAVGGGPDAEPLVVPRRVVSWIWGRDLPEAARLEGELIDVLWVRDPDESGRLVRGDPEQIRAAAANLAAFLSRHGSKRRLAGAKRNRGAP